MSVIQIKQPCVKQICFTPELLSQVARRHKVQTRRIVKYAEDSTIALPAKYRKDDILVVGEEWQSYMYENVEHIIYKRDFPEVVQNMIKWNSAKSLKFDKSRLCLKVTSVWQQKLQDITIEDVFKEGFYYPEIVPENIIRSKFERFWDNLYLEQPEKQWKSNPYVWVYEFILL